jgi:hypothetical protein
VRNGHDQQDGADILAAERHLALAESRGRLSRADASALARVLAIAKRLRLERADPNAPRDCERCAYIEREYGPEVVT